MVSKRFDFEICSRTKLFQSRLALSHAGGGLFCSKKVRKGSLNPNTIPELSKRSIAFGAEKPSNFTGNVVVVNVD